MNINLHIEQLVLDGVSVESHQRPLLKASLEAELGRMLAQEGIASGLQSSGVFKAIQTKPLRVGKSSEPSHIGLQIARMVHGGLK